MNKKRIAVCFYGEIRVESIQLFNEEFIKWDSDRYDFDFFIASWENSFIKDIKFLFTKSKYINFDNLKNFKYPIGNSQQHGANPRSSKSSYLINQVVRIKEDYEFENGFSYDLVVLLRPDFKIDFRGHTDIQHGIQVGGLLTALDNTILANEINPNRPIVSLTHPITMDTERGAFKLNNDHTFIENQQGANLHANLYNLLFLQNIDKKTSYNLGPGNIADEYNPGFSGHMIQGFNFTYHNYIQIVNVFEEILMRNHPNHTWDGGINEK
jgi:hypothetical protein